MQNLILKKEIRQGIENHQYYSSIVEIYLCLAKNISIKKSFYM